GVASLAANLCSSNSQGPSSLEPPSSWHPTVTATPRVRPQRAPARSLAALWLKVTPRVSRGRMRAQCAQWGGVKGCRDQREAHRRVAGNHHAARVALLEDQRVSQQDAGLGD